MKGRAVPSAVFLPVLLFLSLFFSKETLANREPVPFETAYRDGYVFLLWGEHYSAEDRARRLRRVAESGARHVSIPIWGCQSTLTSSDVGGCVMQNRAYAIETARLARAAGFETSFLPILTTANWDWRGFIDPADPDAWFAAYFEWIAGVARDSLALGMKELVVATEMGKAYRHTGRWRGLLRGLRAIYPGPLVMTVNWGGTRVGFWDEADAIGVSAYYPLSASDDPSQDELDHGWRVIHRELVDVARKWRRPVHITEVGYMSARGGARTPWGVPGESVLPDPELQKRCFEAFRRAWRDDPRLVRFNVWATGDYENPSYPVMFDPLGKPAEAVLKGFFGDRGHLLFLVI